MNQADRAGKYMESMVAGEKYMAFIPKPLPPNPPLKLDTDHHELMEKANLAVGRLDGLTALLPDTSLFIYFYIRKEALLSSQIEGTQSSLSDLLLFESEEVPGVPVNDVIEVSNYVAAMDHGLKRLHGGFPLSLRLIKEIHEVLLAKGRGSNKTPGDFRRRSMVDCIMIDSAYNGEVFNVVLAGVPEKKNGLVSGDYELSAPKGKTTIAVKIIDMLGEEVIITEQVKA